MEESKEFIYNFQVFLVFFLLKIVLFCEIKWLFSTREEISNDLAHAASAMKIDPTALDNLVRLWQNTQD